MIRVSWSLYELTETKFPSHGRYQYMSYFFYLSMSPKVRIFWEYLSIVLKYFFVLWSLEEVADSRTPHNQHQPPWQPVGSVLMTITLTNNKAMLLLLPRINGFHKVTGKLLELCRAPGRQCHNYSLKVTKKTPTSYLHHFPLHFARWSSCDTFRSATLPGSVESCSLFEVNHFKWTFFITNDALRKEFCGACPDLSCHWVRQKMAS